MNSKKNTLIVVAGLDGAGKTTLIDHLYQSLSSRSSDIFIQKVSIWDSLKILTKNQIQEYLKDLTPKSRYLFLCHAIQNSLEKALKIESDSSSKRILLLDSYWYKYASIEMNYGLTKEWTLKLMESFKVPDAVIYLKIAPNDCLNRKKIISSYESGFSEEKEKKFIELQTKAELSINLFFPENITTTLDATKSPSRLTLEALNLILENK